MGGWVGCAPGGGSATCGGSSGGNTGGGSSGGNTGGSTGSGLASILSEATFNAIFPNRNGAYTYKGLLDAAQTYPAFAGTGDTAARKREVAAFLANVAHETGRLVYVEEIVKGPYCQPSAACPCAPGKQYFGRGALQLSWNYNYCAAGSALGVNLQANPDLVATTPRLAWLTGMWFWMTSSGAGNQKPHDAINTTGFGETIRAINGSLECNGGNRGAVQARVSLYREICGKLGVDVGSGRIDC
jgi:chitinase